MKVSYIQCDGPGCGLRHDIEPPAYGGRLPVAASRWIVIHRACSTTGDKLPAGESHFCSEDCLRGKLQHGTSVLSPEPLIAEKMTDDELKALMREPPLECRDP